ncbi:MAG: 4Fe-4S dicluster domain-containing protein [Planctomycetes bacterium]|nr:4Fe-4S dicluster domain-containing protein [Planctomycetota bacterium]
MSIKKLNKDVFKSFVDSMIASDQSVVGVKEKVQAKGNKFAFGPLENADQLRLDYDVTLIPPKKYMLPQTETLLTYEVKGESKQHVDEQKLILVGVHPYDMIAINQMDELFSQDEYDTHYMTRRNNITVIACDVVNASENIFASSMETAVVEKGFDILLTDLGKGKEYVAEAITEKGEALLATAVDATDADDKDIAKRSAIQEANKKDLDKHTLNCKPSELSSLLEQAYEHPVWEEKAKTCFSCGSCNTTCPTCYCFDVQDLVNWNLKDGQRERSWDGCLLKDFANVAGDHNFRKQKESRFRHRLYRKGKYVPTKIGGQVACVGCGRCVGACVPDIANPVAVYNRLLEDIKP